MTSASGLGSLGPSQLLKCRGILQSHMRDKRTGSWIFLAALLNRGLRHLFLYSKCHDTMCFHQEPMFIWLLSGFILGLNPTAALKGDRRCQETLFYELFRKRSVRPTLSIIQFYSLSQFHRIQYEHTWVLTSELTQINKDSQPWWHTAIIPVLGRPK